MATACAEQHLFWGDQKLMTEETLDELCKDCGPTFAAFLEEMAAHNKETAEELGKEVGLYQEAEVEPAVDFGRLSSVLVLLVLPPESAPERPASDRGGRR